MRKASFLLVVLFLVSIQNLWSQENYRVIKVNGQIIYVNTGNNMSQGDVFSEDENLSFGTQNSRAAVINPNTGRFILTPENYDDLSSGNSNFLPAMSNLSTRGGAINNLADLQNQFVDYLTIFHSASYHINPNAYPMNENSFFYLSFNHEGEEINKKLDFEGTKLTLARESILKIDGQPIPEIEFPIFTLNYLDDGEPTYISDFAIIFPDAEEINPEIRIILDESKEKSYNAIINDISGYVFEFYGKPDKEDVMYYLEKEFGLKKE
jgi:hypothetical protein